MKCLYVATFFVLFNVLQGKTPPRQEPSKTTDICSRDAAMENLDMSKMEGFWYITNVTFRIPPWVRMKIQPIVCGVYNIVKNPISGYELNFYTGKTFGSAKKYSIVSEMRAQNASLAKNETAFTVFATDYTNYAGVVSCEQSLSDTNRRLFVLSRTTNVVRDFVAQAQESMTSKFNLEYAHLMEASNQNCSALDTISNLPRSK